MQHVLSTAVGQSLKNFAPVHLTFNELEFIILNKVWSPSVYVNDERSKQNFIEATLIALDFDEGLSIEDGIELFKDHNHIIGTTKNHRKAKHGIVADRFRVILELSSPIKDAATYEATIRKLLEIYPQADKACKDAARMFYPCVSVVSASNQLMGLSIDPVTPLLASSASTKNIVSNNNNAVKGELSKATLKFLQFGAKPGSWNHSLAKAAIDANEQNYSEAEFIEMAEKITGHLDQSDLKTISSGFNRVPKYEPRMIEEVEPGSYAIVSQVEPGSCIGVKPGSCSVFELADGVFSYLSDKTKIKGDSTGFEGLDELLGGGLRLGEFTALMASAKTGKNSLLHSIMHRMLSKGHKLAYASRELSPEEIIPNLLSIEFKENAWKINLTEDIREKYLQYLQKSELYIAKGYGVMPFEELSGWIRELHNTKGVNHFFVDHLHYCLYDSEDFKEASKFARAVKSLTKELNIQVFMIIQPKQLMDGQKLSLNTLRGGAAIGQAIDCLLTMQRETNTEQKNISKLTLEVARHKLASPGSIFLQYDKDSTDFIEMTPEAIADDKEDSELTEVAKPWQPKLLK